MDAGMRAWRTVGVCAVMIGLCLAGCEPGNGTGNGGDAGGELRITSATPADQSTNVSVNGPISFGFNREVDPATMAGAIQPISADFELQWSDGNSTVTLALSAPLAANTTYAVTVNWVMDAAGNILSNPTTVCFSTGAALDCPTVVACQTFDATDAGVPAAADHTFQRPFADDSVWNTPIGDNPAVDPNSNAMIQRFAQAYDQFGGMWFGVIQDVTPIYLADATTPRHDVPLSDPSLGITVFNQVPIPDHAIPDCGSDFFMVVWDTEARRFYDFWRARNEDGTWSAATIGSIDATGNGVFAEWEGVRASGFALAAGQVWPQEFTAGKIEHALVCAYNYVRSGTFVAPATSTDGQNDDPAAIPMGARLQLDPSLDLSTLGLDPWERTAAEAMQTYGLFVGDTGGGIGVSLLHVYSLKGNPYKGILPDEIEVANGVLLNKLPADRFRVLQAN